MLQWPESVNDFDERQNEEFIKLMEAAQKNPEIQQNCILADVANLLHKILFIENGNPTFAQVLRSSLGNEKCNRQTLIIVLPNKKKVEINYLGHKMHLILLPIIITALHTNCIACSCI